MADKGPILKGTKGEGADIDLNIPLPGSHTGRRLLKIEDIPDDYFLDSASDSGTSYADLLGLAKDAQTGDWSIGNVNQLVKTWTARKTSVESGVSSTELQEVQAALIADAEEVISARGSLKEWSTEGALFRSRIATSNKSQ